MLFKTFLYELEKANVKVEQKYYKVGDLLFAFPNLLINGNEYEMKFQGVGQFCDLTSLYDKSKHIYVYPKDLIKRLSTKYRKQGYTKYPGNCITIHASMNSTNKYKIIISIGTKKSTKNIQFRQYFYTDEEKTIIRDYIQNIITQEAFIELLNLTPTLEKAMLLSA